MGLHANSKTYDDLALPVQRRVLFAGEHTCKVHNVNTGLKSARHLIAPRNKYTCSCMPEQTVSPCLLYNFGVRDQHLLGRHTHVTSLHRQCNAKHRAILVMLSHESLHHLISVANDSVKSLISLAMKRPL